MLFNLVFSRIYHDAVFYDLTSLGNFYSLVLTKLFLLLLVGSCIFACILYAVLVFLFFVLIFLFLSADENNNIDIGAI